MKGNVRKKEHLSTLEHLGSSKQMKISDPTLDNYITLF